jgi:lipopolysaccharide export system permease protein
LDYYCSVSFRKICTIEQEITKQQLPSEMAIARTGIWLKDVNRYNSYIIHTASLVPSRRLFCKVQFFEFDAANRFLRSIYANEATIKNGYWIIENPMEFEDNDKVSGGRSISIETTLSFDGIGNMITNPRGISFWNIKKYGETMAKIGLSALQYNLHWFSQLSIIFQMIAMALLGAAFCVEGNDYSRGQTLKLGLVVVSAFPIYFVNNLLIAFGVNERIPIWMATLFFPIATIVTIVCSKSKSFL